MKLRNAILESLPFEILILSVEIVLRRQIFPFSLSLSRSKVLASFFGVSSELEISVFLSFQVFFF